MDEVNDNLMEWKVGETYIFSIPPGWLVGGTIRSISASGKWIQLENALYLETVVDGYIPMSHLPRATSPRQHDGVMRKAHCLPHGHKVMVDAVFQACPCNISFEHLYRRQLADEAKKVQ